MIDVPTEISTQFDAQLAKKLVSGLLKLSNLAAVEHLPRLHTPVRFSHRKAKEIRQLSQV